MNTAVMERPSREEYVPVEKARTIGDALKSKDTIARFQQAAPKHLNAERMLRLCALAVYKTPDLAKCEVMSLLGAMLTLGSLGLEPNTPLGHAYLIPFRSRRKVGTKWEDYFEVNVVIGYKGLIDLARRSGMMVAIHADVVYGPINTPGHDKFDYHYGTDMKLYHRPSDEGNRDRPMFAYAYASLVDGQAFEVLPYNLVMNIRNKSQGYQAALNAKSDAANDPTKAYRMKAYDTNPWVAFEHEMAAKTMIRRLAKSLPMSVEFARAVDLDEMSESHTVDFAAVARSTDAIEYAPIQPVEPPADRPEPETVDRKVEVSEPVAQAKRQPRRQPVAEQQAATVPPPPPPPPPPEAARVEPEQQAEEPQIAEAAFELTTGDGEILEWTDWDDFPGAYKEELGRAFSGYALAGGDGFYETNRATFLKWAKSNQAQAAELEQNYAALRKSYTPPDETSDGGDGKGLF